MARSASEEGIQKRFVIKAYIRSYTKENGYPPTVRELARAFGIPMTTMNFHLLSMRASGDITWVDRSARTMKVVDITDEDSEDDPWEMI